MNDRSRAVVLLSLLAVVAGVLTWATVAGRANDGPLADADSAMCRTTSGAEVCLRVTTGGYVAEAAGLLPHSTLTVSVYLVGVSFDRVYQADGVGSVGGGGVAVVPFRHGQAIALRARASDGSRVSESYRFH